MYQIINGKELADSIIATIAQQIIDEGIEPQLAVVLVGNDPASHLYVSLKEKACKGVGINLDWIAFEYCGFADGDAKPWLLWIDRRVS